MKKGSVILPGSYDPVTLGHVELIKRAAEKYAEVHVVAFINPKKTYRFSVGDRVKMLKLATKALPSVKVDFSDGFVVDYMREHGIEKIFKGYRSERDLVWEREQAEYNFSHGGYETELIMLGEEYREISSTVAREALLSGGELCGILPEAVIEYVRRL